MIPVIIDCDPGHDDAIALLLALASPGLDVRLVTVCSGNQTVEKTLANTLKVLSFVSRPVEVAAGAAKPLLKKLETAEIIHGVSGLDGPVLHEHNLRASNRSALEAQVDIIMNSRTKVTLISTGPMTNTAILIASHPEVKEKLERIVFMGGACFGGNWTPKAEYNIYVDPEAASLVMGAGIPLTMCGLDVTKKARIFPQEIERIRNLGNKTGIFVAELLDFFGKSHTPQFLAESGEDKGLHLHDVCAVAWVIRPELFVFRSLHVEVETTGQLTLGSTVVDYDDVYGREKNVEVCFSLEREVFIETLIEAIAGYK